MRLYEAEVKLCPIFLERIRNGWKEEKNRTYLAYQVTVYLYSVYNNINTYTLIYTFKKKEKRGEKNNEVSTTRFVVQ